MSRYSLIQDPHDARLYAPNAKVNPLSPKTEAIAGRVYRAFIRSGGIGLAAPQIGINKQIIIVRHFENYERNRDRYQDNIWLNPQLVDIPEKDNDLYWYPEGCLSHPGVSVEIARPKWIIVEVNTLNSGKKQILQLAGMTARCFLHELDHLRGVLITDKGVYGRNITLNAAGQQILMDSLKKNQEQGYVAPEI